MKTMADKMKDILSNMSKEEFLNEWAEIEDLNLDGPSATDYVAFLKEQTILSKPNSKVTYQEPSSFDDENLPNFTLAA